MQDVVKTLIDRAADRLGSKAELGRQLGVARARVSDWHSGVKPCKPDDLAAIAFFAGYNAMNVLAAATIAENEGTPVGEILKAQFGSQVPPLAAYLSANHSQKIRCVLC